MFLIEHEKRSDIPTVGCAPCEAILERSFGTTSTLVTQKAPDAVNLPRFPLFSPAEQWAGRILFAEHTPAGHNQYGSCDVAGYRLDEGPDDKIRISHRTPAVDLLDPDRPSSDDQAAERHRHIDAYAATLTALGWTVERRGPNSRHPYLLALAPAEKWEHGDVVLDARSRIWTRAREIDAVQGWPWATGADATLSHGKPYATEGGHPEEAPARPLTLLVRNGKAVTAQTGENA
jgi:hypothetical protein